MNNVEILANKSDGLAGKMFEELTNAFQPNRFNFSTDMTSCLPEPYKPDFERNYTIILIGILTVMLDFLEPFGKRLKVRIMNFYYPTIARRRAVWLYNHILRTRNRFTKEARRRLRRQYRSWDLEEPESTSLLVRFRSKVGHMLPCSWTMARQLIIPTQHHDFCILCKVYWAPEDPLTRCATPGCRGTYCLECFASLQNLCTICLRPEQYNDISDISEECDSSEDGQQRNVLRGECDSEESLMIHDDDFETDSDFDVHHDTGDEENYDTPEQFLPRVLQPTACYDEKEKDWATMKDFTLPDSEQEQDLNADYGISMTLALRLKKGFSGLIFAKPVFGQPADTSNHSSTSKDVSTSDSEVTPDKDTQRCELQKSKRRWLSEAMSLPSKLSRASKQIWKRIRRPSHQEDRCQKNVPKRPTSPSYCDYGSGSDTQSRMSYNTSHRSLVSTNISDRVDVFKTLRRPPRNTDRQVYYGLMSSDKYGRHSSGTEEEPNSDSSADFTLDTRSSLRSFSVKSLSRDASSLSTVSTIEDGRSSYFEDGSDRKRRKRRRDDQMSSGLRTGDVGMTEIQIIPPKLQKRPSFRSIKIRPTQAQVTHKIFNVDEEDFIE